MRILALAVFTACAAACGTNDGEGGVGAVQEEILVDRVATNGCVMPSEVGWTDPRAPLTGGVTGDSCSFSGGSADGSKVAICINEHLLMQTSNAAPDQSACGAGGSGPLLPKLTAQDCVESCTNSGGASVACLTVPARAPSRQLSTPWPLAAGSDCDALMSGCPEVGDPCTGSMVCSAFWHPNQPAGSEGFEGFDAVMWCDSGALKLTVAF